MRETVYRGNFGYLQLSTTLKRKEEGDVKIKQWGLQGFLILVCAFSFCEVASAIQTVKTFETGTFTGTANLGQDPCFIGNFVYAAGDEEIAGLDYSASTPGGTPGVVTISCTILSGTAFTFEGTFSTPFDGKVVGEMFGDCTVSVDQSGGCLPGTIICNQQLVFDCPGCIADPALPVGLTFPEMETVGTTTTTGGIFCANSGTITATVIETTEAEADTGLTAGPVTGDLISPSTTAGGVDYDIAVSTTGDLSAAYVTVPLADAIDGDNDPPPGFGISTDPAQFWDINFTGTFSSMEMTLGYDDTNFICTDGTCGGGFPFCNTASDCEAGQVIYHYTGAAGGWDVIVPDDINTSLNTVTFTTTSLSLFTMGGPPPPIPALSNRGLVVFLFLAMGGALYVIRRRRSRSMSG